ncbi:PIGM, partial [Symbiodinium sp. KB8]
PARKYTDVDYVVFTDAAREVVASRPSVTPEAASEAGDGMAAWMFGLGSPYDRATYRYTPFLAWLAVPNVTVAFAWGKLVFAAVDVLVGWLIADILRARGVAPRAAAAYASLWLFSPIAANISTRGSADCIVVALSLLALRGIIRGHEVAAALWLGAAVHFKIFPALFAIPMALAIDQHSDPASRPAEPLALLAPGEADAAAAAGRAMASWPAGDSLLTRATDCGRPGSSAEACLRWVRGFVSYRRVRFGVVSLAACGALTGAAVALYGHRCLHDAYIYHLGRTDPRHNFSPYFYSLYLADGTAGAASLGLAAFLPQLAVVLAAGFGLYRDLPLAMLVQAVAFVALNKVCTAQYFLWWQGLLPVAAAAARLGAPRSRDWFSASAGWALVAALFLAGQAGWLLQASDLEEGGRQTFLGVWGAGLVFLAVNTVVMVGLVLAGRGAPPVFHRGGLVKLGAAAGGGAIAPVEWALQAAGL